MGDGTGHLLSIYQLRSAKVVHCHRRQVLSNPVIPTSYSAGCCSRCAAQHPEHLTLSAHCPDFSVLSMLDKTLTSHASHKQTKQNLTRYPEVGSTSVSSINDVMSKKSFEFVPPKRHRPNQSRIFNDVDSMRFDYCFSTTQGPCGKSWIGWLRSAAPSEISSTRLTTYHISRA